MAAPANKGGRAGRGDCHRPIEHSSLSNCLTTRLLAEREVRPGQTLLQLALGQQILLARITSRSARRLALARTSRSTPTSRRSAWSAKVERIAEEAENQDGSADESRGNELMRRNQVMKSTVLPCAARGGALLLLLHGLGSSSLDWQAQIERFSEHYRVVALDLRGHGQSMQEGPFDVATLAADVVNWLDEQPEPAWVVGLSLGAMVALELALQLPHKVQGLVLVNGFSEFLLETPKSRSALPSASSGCAGSACSTRLVAWPRALSRPRPCAGASHLPAAFRAQQEETYKALLEALPGWSVRARLGNIWQPVAIISTSHDYLPLAKRVEQFASCPTPPSTPQRPPCLAGGRSLRLQSSVAADPLYPLMMWWRTVTDKKPTSWGGFLLVQSSLG